jgi:hypothetical protein
VVLVVPGYYGTYWVKHLSDIEMIDQVYDGFWMKPAYRVPDNGCACVEPGIAPAATRPIGRFNVRSFITSVSDGARLPAGREAVVRGIAFDGGQGIREVACLHAVPAAERRAAVLEAMVKRMRVVFNAPVREEDMPAIVDYLVKTYGNEQSR